MGILRLNARGTARREVLLTRLVRRVASIALQKPVERVGGRIAFRAFAGGG